MKVLFIHGLASSGAYKMAKSLEIILRPCEVIAPDVPIDPAEALALLRGICEEQRPDLVVGLSLGGFWAQKLRGQKKILVNPDFHVSALLRAMIGENEYLSPRRDGARSFTVTPSLCDAYEQLELSEFDALSKEEIALTAGLFALEDERVRQCDEFESHYPGRAVRYHGRHLPNNVELSENIPLVIGLFD